MTASRRRANSVIGLAAVLAFVSSCKGSVSEASVTIPDKRARVTVRRVAVHQFLAEYSRRLIVESEGRAPAELEMDLDSGGAAHIKVYRVGSGLLFLRDRFGAYEVDLAGRITAVGVSAVPSDAVFIGAFDNDREGLSGNWRYLAVAERPERPILGDTGSK